MSTPKAAAPPPDPLVRATSEQLRLERLEIQLDRVEKRNCRLKGHVQTAQEHGVLPVPKPPLPAI